MKQKQLTAADRGAIEILLRKKYTYSNIARELLVNRSTICREIKSRSTLHGYDADIAQLDYQNKRKLSRKKLKLSSTSTKNFILNKLLLGWSPEQISGRLNYLDIGFNIHFETIYRFIYSDPLSLEDKWFQYLRFGRTHRKKKLGRNIHKSKIPNRVSIHSRPDIVLQRSEIGHWEGDTVIYNNMKAINTLNELKSGFVAFSKLDRKTAELNSFAVNNKLSMLVSKSLTVDNGSEWMLHEKIKQLIGIQVFFSDPYSSWQRGANENVNMLLRGYLPKKSNIDDLLQVDLDDIANELNNRPRKRLGFRTPNEVYTEEVYSLSTVAIETRI